MTKAIRTTARAIHTALNFCLNPMCLHSTKTKGCECCKRGCGARRKAPARTRARR